MKCGCKCAKCTPAVRLPNWADSMLLVSGSAWRSFELTFTVGDQPLQLLPADPTRVMFGWNQSMMPGDADVYLQGTSNLFSFSRASGGMVNWLSTFTHGPIVSAAWDCWSGGFSFVIRGVEVYSLQ